MKSERHHYVPEWYQRRFIPSGAKDNNLWLLDLSPERVDHPGGGFHYLKDLRRRGPDVSFYEDNLYRLHFGKFATNVVEQRFFGAIDRDGASAVDAMAEFEFGKTSGKFITPFIRYLDAQKLRTPKGLDWLKASAGNVNHETAIVLMGHLSQMHTTIWMEGVWQIFKCDHTETKLIVSDHPVTVYNRQIPPTDKGCGYPSDPGIDLIGTQTLFPLRPDRLLVISNLQFARNHWVNGRVQRINPRMMGDTLMFLGGIQTGAQLNEGEVRAANYITKKRAKKYIAAGQKEWLYPEDVVKARAWGDLGGEFFLRPDPRPLGFKGEMYVGMKDGSSWGMDEFGRDPNNDDPQRKKAREGEWDYFVKTMALWDRKRGRPAVKAEP